jgi:hypothetical protein
MPLLLLFPRNGPQVDRVLRFKTAVALGRHRDDLFRLGAAHVEVVRDNPRAGLQLLKLRHELHVQAGQQIQRHHVRLRKVQLEDVGVADRDQIFHLVLLDVLERLLDALRVDVEAVRLDFFAAVTTMRPSPQPKS